jgi:putative Mn2+ efflux pump MntP
MELNFVFFFNSILLGFGLAMDAFSVSMANGLNEPTMKQGKMWSIAGIFGLFQGLMPLLGWICIHTIVQYFTAFETLIPWIALALLSYIGGKMLLDGLHPEPEEAGKPGLGLAALLVQGVATSIDALSVGFTIAEYDLPAAALAALIIAAVTVITCYLGVIIGKTVGNRIAGKANILGGVILIIIGIEIFVTGVFFK